MVKEKLAYELNLPKATISSAPSKLYPIVLLLTFNKNNELLCSTVNESCSIIIPFRKNIKSSSEVLVNPLGADAVVAVKLAVLTLTKLPVCVKLFL